MRVITARGKSSRIIGYAETKMMNAGDCTPRIVQKTLQYAIEEVKVSDAVSFYILWWAQRGGRAGGALIGRA